jgi:hypothetical protein
MSDYEKAIFRVAVYGSAQAPRHMEWPSEQSIALDRQTSQGDK